MIFFLNLKEQSFRVSVLYFSAEQAESEKEAPKATNPGKDKQSNTKQDVTRGKLLCS